MINITIVCVGKIKEQYLSQGVAEYHKRLSRFSKIDIIEVDDERIIDNNNPSLCEQVLEIEGVKILAKIPKEAYVITLEITGETFSSEELAVFIDKISTYQNSKLVFVIGGSLGLSPRVKAITKKAISFSKMTFPHQLMRLILFEQLYRSFTILSNITYHK